MQNVNPARLRNSDADILDANEFPTLRFSRDASIGSENISWTGMPESSTAGQLVARPGLEARRAPLSSCGLLRWKVQTLKGYCETGTKHRSNSGSKEIIKRDDFPTWSKDWEQSTTFTRFRQRYYFIQFITSIINKKCLTLITSKLADPNNLAIRLFPNMYVK